MSTFRLRWSGGWRDCSATNQYGVVLRVRFMVSSGVWAVYTNGRLRKKSDTRESAKRLAADWFREER